MKEVLLDKPSLSQYRSLGSYLQSFSDITQIDALYYSLSGVLVHHDHVYTDEKQIQLQLDIHEFINYTIYPVILDYKFSGFILCNSAKISQQRVKLSKDYITNIFEEVFDSEPEHGVHTSVLDSLNTQEFNHINYLSILLKISPQYHNFDETNPNPVAEHLENDYTESFTSLKKANAYVVKNITKPLSLNEVSNRVYLSPSYLSRLFKKYLNITFIDYINHLKIAKAKELLALSTRPVNIIANDVGFSQTSYFTKTFKKMAGTTPSLFRRRHAATTKIFTIPHVVSWSEDDTVFDVSKRYFKDKKIDFFYQTANDFLYVNSIDGLTDSTENRGWLFTVDGNQPTESANQIKIDSIAEIQWIYTDLGRL